jgi:uncharacterized protein
MKRLVVMLIVVLIAGLSFFATHKGFAQASPVGRWEGAINLPGMNLGIIVQFDRNGDSLQGTIDIPQQMAKGLRLHNIGMAGAMLHFTLEAGPAVANFVGTMAADSISGLFAQGNVKCPFILKRAAAPVVIPPSYRTEEIHIPSGNVVLAGTLSLPSGPGPHPAVILLTGSGAQNRDEEIFGFAPFKILADSLTIAGLAVLRCDDRGIGGSTGKYAEATTDTFAADGRALFQFLRDRPDIRKDAIGVFGHSEGGVATTMLCSAHHDVAFAVLLAGPAVGGDAIILGQIERLARAGGASDSAIAAATTAQKRVYDAVRSDNGWEDVRAMLFTQMKESVKALAPAQRAAAGINDSVLAARVDAQMAGIKSPWFKRFITYDPAPDIAKITCPVLALYGSLDMQVPTAQNVPALESIVRRHGMTNVTIRVIDGANHLFQQAKTGQPSEYGTLAKAFVPGVPSLIVAWIARIVLH